MSLNGIDEETAARIGEGAARERELYGRRKGKKLRVHQAQLMASLLPSLAISKCNGLLDPAALFGRSIARLEIEIGFGGGERLAHAAQQTPEVGFIGCEPFENGVAKLLTRVEASGLTNIRLHMGDGAEILDALPEACVDCIHLLFPDPWPKRRQRKRRFVRSENLSRIARALKCGGEFRFATDIDDYAAWTLARVLQRPEFEWRADQADDWRKPWLGWPGTRYEAKARAAGRQPVYLTVARSARAP